LPTLAPTILNEILSGGGEDYVPFAGQSVGLIHDIRPARDIMIDTIEDAERIIRSVIPESVQHF
jgi:enoyl-[acyl-carrier protein] reductase II